MKKFPIFIFILALTLVLTGTRAAHAEEIDCVGTLGAITVDNVLVPDGATCTLDRTIVQGTVNVGTGSTLRALRANINGNIQAEGARNVIVRQTIVGGSIQIVQGGAARIDRTTIMQDLFFDSNAGLVTARSNMVNGNIQAFQNTGGVTILTNTVDGNLQCTGNIPAPMGGGNIVQGDKQDQCENL